jgi:hypothetical protein
MELTLLILVDATNRQTVSSEKERHCIPEAELIYGLIPMLWPDPYAGRGGIILTPS